MAEMNIKIMLKCLEQVAIGLDKIHVTASENVKLKIPSHKLTISTWMKIYKGAKTSEQRKRLREIAIKITEMYGCKNAVCEHGTFTSKFELSSPYNFFLTTISQLEETFKQPYSLSFHEIIDYTGGEIVDSLHINFVLDVLWLMTEYMLAAQYPKMTVICGGVADPLHQTQIPFDITIVEVEMKEFGCHHSKISIVKYKNDSIRIIITTANLYRSDWEIWSQGIWVSPILPPLPEDAVDTDGESITHFKKDFMTYFNAYKQTELNEWKSVIYRADCSDIKVFFFASVPGHHEGSSINLWGHKRLYHILKEQATLPNNAKDWSVVAQSSSVGEFGQHYQNWMSTHIVHPMAQEKNKRIIHLPQFRFLYPTQEIYDNSFGKQTGETPLVYYEEQHLRQQWIENHLYQWAFEKTGRTRAMPHCKCYTRISPDETEIAWFILTSANLSKAAWGKMIKGGVCQYITSYEAGVIFIPQVMINQTTFPIKKSDDSTVPVFLLPYDLPLIPYEPGIKPALVPGDRPTQDMLEEIEKQAETNSAEQEETDSIFNDERVKKMFEDLLKPEKINYPTENKCIVTEQVINK